MSKNVVDTIIKFSLEHKDIPITFIPTRRQIDFDRGYCNNWNTKEFCQYVRTRNPLIQIERDHGGPNQGTNEDDGYSSLKDDVLHMNIIHLDPFKYATNLKDGIKWTIDMLNFCYKLNPETKYEIGTEESIFKLEVADINELITTVKLSVDNAIFNNIKYVVIQCGTKLKDCVNTGEFDETKLIEMLSICDKHNIIAKEHNGDWISASIVDKKKKCGLTCINIAPELAEIETSVILEQVKANIDDYDALYNLCLESKKWTKWILDEKIVSKDKIILTCCHYLYMTEEFKRIKSKYTDIDKKIGSRLIRKIYDFYRLV